MRIDKSKLPSKYALGIYKMVQNISSTDILYELVSILEDRNALEEPFAVETLLKEVSSRIEGQELSSTLDVLVDEGWLKREGSTYKLTGHPWK